MVLWITLVVTVPLAVGDVQGHAITGVLFGSSLFARHVWGGITDSFARLLPQRPKAILSRRRRLRIRPPRFFPESRLALKVSLSFSSPRHGVHCCPPLCFAPIDVFLGRKRGN